MKGFLAFILVALLFISSLGFVASRLQNPDFLIDQAKEANLYGRLTSQLGEVLPKQFIQQFPISTKAFAEVVIEAIPADEFYNFLHAYASAYLNYWTGNSQNINLSYSLKNIKERGKTAMANKVIADYDKLPVCSAEQARNWDISSQFPSCRLQDGLISRDSIDTQLKELSAKAINDLPGSVEVSGINKQQKANRNLLKTINTGIKVVWILTLLIIILMVVVWRQKSFIALAIALLFVGLVQIGFSLVAWDWIAKNIGDIIAGNGGSAQFAPLALDAIAAALDVLKRTLDSLTILIIGSGGALLVLGIIGAVKGRQTIDLTK